MHRGDEPPMGFVVGMSWCHQHHKIAYRSRRQARRAARQKHPSEHLSPYPCGNGLWHIGHLPARVIAGDEDRRTYYDR